MRTFRSITSKRPRPEARQVSLWTALPEEAARFSAGGVLLSTGFDLLCRGTVADRGRGASSVWPGENARRRGKAAGHSLWLDLWVPVLEAASRPPHSGVLACSSLSCCWADRQTAGAVRRSLGHALPFRGWYRMAPRCPPVRRCGSRHFARCWVPLSLSAGRPVKAGKERTSAGTAVGVHPQRTGTMAVAA